jgi:hypothetical protein
MSKALRTLSILVALMTFACVAHAQVVGKVEKIEGAPEVLRSGTSQWVPIGPTEPVSVGDQLRTREGSKIAIRLNDDSVLTLAEKTVMAIDEQTLKPSGQNTSVFSLLLGKLRAVVADQYKKPGSRFEVHTPTAVAGVRGTEFVAETTGDESKFFGLKSETTVQARAFGVCQRFKGCGS